MNLKIISTSFDNDDKRTFTAILKDSDGVMFDGDLFPCGVVIGKEEPEGSICRWLNDLYQSGGIIPDDPPKQTDEEFATQIREERNQLLSRTDYLMQSDYPISETDRESVRAYRQALRDIPAQPGFPRDVVWPDKPPFLA